MLQCTANRNIDNIWEKSYFWSLWSLFQYKHNNFWMWNQLSGKATHRAGFLTTPNPIYPPKIPSKPQKRPEKPP